MISTLLSGSIFYLWAQGLPDINSSKNTSLLGTKTLYRYIPTEQTPLAGYKPVFINYVGRHGARYLTDGKDINNLEHVLLLADRNGNLNKKGHALLLMLQRFKEIEEGNYGNITLSGKDEQEGIAFRMHQRYPDVFKRRGFKIVMTQKVRTQQSEQAFLKAFPQYPRNKIHAEIPPDSLNNDLRFYDISRAYRQYKRGNKIRIRIDSLNNSAETKAVIKHTCTEIFNGSFCKKFEHGDIVVNSGKKKKLNYSAENFAEDLFGLYTISFSIQKEIKKRGWIKDSVNFGYFFSLADKRWLAFVDGAKEYLEKGPAIDTLGIQIRDAVPLLVDFIKTTDNYIHSPNSADAVLRFAHAETISPLATLLGIRSASVSSPSIFQYTKYWQPAKIIPLSANIQWILFVNKNGHYLVKVLLNEEPVKLPIKTGLFPFYDWEKLKHYYLHKLALLHVNKSDNMHEYLLRLK